METAVSLVNPFSSLVTKYPLISAQAVSSQGRECWAPSSPSAAGRWPCLLAPGFLITQERVGAQYLPCKAEQPSGARPSVCHEGHSLLSKDGTKKQWDPAGKRHSTKPGQGRLARVIQVLAPAITGESAGRFV